MQTSNSWISVISRLPIWCDLGAPVWTLERRLRWDMLPPLANPSLAITTPFPFTDLLRNQDYQERVFAYNYTASTEDRFDKDNLEVEGFGGTENLMLWGAVNDTGYPLGETVFDACSNAADWVLNK